MGSEMCIRDSSMIGQLTGGWSMVLQANAAQARIDAGDTDPRLTAKLATASFYCEQLLPLAFAHEAAVLGHAKSLTALDPSLF